MSSRSVSTVSPYRLAIFLMAESGGSLLPVSQLRTVWGVTSSISATRTWVIRQRSLACLRRLPKRRNTALFALAAMLRFSSSIRALLWTSSCPQDAISSYGAQAFCSRSLFICRLCVNRMKSAMVSTDSGERSRLRQQVGAHGPVRVRRFRRGRAVSAVKAEPGHGFFVYQRQPHHHGPGWPNRALFVPPQGNDAHSGLFGRLGLRHSRYSSGLLKEERFHVDSLVRRLILALRE